MTSPRKQQISLYDTPYYHLVSRCVRRAFLCGKDSLSGQSFEHRRQWIVNRMKFLSSIFAIDMCSYAVMSNHYHLVIRVNCTNDWSDKQVLCHWASLFSLPLLCQRYLENKSLDKVQMDYVSTQVEVYRERLMSISWFMKCLNEYIALKANREDHVKGHFWESRFKSQALLDEKALLTCMAYVDLNPIRAAMARTPETSDFTSIQERILCSDSTLVGFGNSASALDFSLSDYLSLVDITGRCIREDKTGHIPTGLSDILLRLGLPSDNWMNELKRYSTDSCTVVGTVDQLKQFCSHVGKKWAWGFKLASALE